MGTPPRRVIRSKAERTGSSTGCGASPGIEAVTKSTRERGSGTSGMDYTAI